MPELPEIEVIRRDLEKEIVGRRAKEVQVRPGSNAMKVISRHGRRKDFQDLLVGAKVERIDRRGRALLLELDNARTLVFELGRTGQLLKTSASDDIATHTHIVIAFTIGGHLRFSDPSKEGEVYVIPNEEVAEATGTSAIDPLDQPLAWHHFSALLEERETILKDLLMDEDFMVGIGDIYSDEILFAAGLRYDRPSNKLSSQDVRRLYRALMEILQEAVKARGTSWGEPQFTDLQGDPGQYQLELKVYEREGEFCRRCRNAIVKEPFGDGYTYFCPQCQS
ncbi:MAG: bifunctional DNA-formamidopyrimidine glycosylase/DNA-(apurinic or apyrimidinic site) lyase [Actinomycetota bacterium]|nr:bifunctional DNA-formamidopyrimidine glycosylase/DNA-(apurinic or apyrimidinic site) lyase [Actinomycetota bacterium]